jgi:hypothetical protein
LGCQFFTHKYFTFGKSEIVYSSRRPASNRGVRVVADGEVVWS